MANDLPNPKSRNEEILTNLINGESVSDIRPKSRIEVLLKN